MDILITNTAKIELDKLLNESTKKCIRIITKCITMHDEARLSFELDDMKKNDIMFEVDGYQVIMDVNLANQLYSLTISYGGLMSRDKFCVEGDFGFFEF